MDTIRFERATSLGMLQKLLKFQSSRGIFTEYNIDDAHSYLDIHQR